MKLINIFFFTNLFVKVIWWFQEKLEDTKRIIRSHKSKDRQTIQWTKRITNDLQNTAQKTKELATRITLNMKVNTQVPRKGRQTVSALHVWLFCCDIGHDDGERLTEFWQRQTEHIRDHMLCRNSVTGN
jgi:hypothetical protein